MARKAKFDTKTLVVHGKILEFEKLYKRIHFHEAAILAMALRQSLTFGEKASLGRFEAMFWEKAKETDTNTKEAQTAVKAYHEKNGGEKRGVIPSKDSMAQIIADCIDGGQQTNKGRKLKRNMDLLLKGDDLERWLDLSDLSEDEVSRWDSWANEIISETWNKWLEIKNYGSSFQ